MGLAPNARRVAASPVFSPNPFLGMSRLTEKLQSLQYTYDFQTRYV